MAALVSSAISGPAGADAAAAAAGAGAAGVPAAGCAGGGALTLSAAVFWLTIASTASVTSTLGLIASVAPRSTAIVAPRCCITGDDRRLDALADLLADEGDVALDAAPGACCSSVCAFCCEVWKCLDAGRQRGVGLLALRQRGHRGADRLLLGLQRRAERLRALLELRRPGA